MFVLIDHLTAVVVGATLLGSMIFVQQRGQQSAISTTVRHVTQTQGYVLTTALASDVENLYAVPGDLPNRTGWSTADTSVTSLFTFHTLATPADPDAGLVAVAYRLERPAAGDTTMHRVARYVNDNSDDDGDGSVWDYTGGHGGGIRGFDVDLAETSSAIDHSNSMGAIAGFNTLYISFTAEQDDPTHRAADQRYTTKMNRTSQTLTIRPIALSVDQSTPVPSGAPDSRLAIPYPSGWQAPLSGGDESSLPPATCTAENAEAGECDDM